MRDSLNSCPVVRDRLSAAPIGSRTAHVCSADLTLHFMFFLFRRKLLKASTEPSASTKLKAVLRMRIRTDALVATRLDIQPVH